jgi:hypothetical protein
MTEHPPTAAKAPDLTPHCQEILAVIDRAVDHLTPEAHQDIGDYLRRHFSPEGGFVNRAGIPDLYYTMFGLTCALALRLDLPYQRVSDWLARQPQAHRSLIDLSCQAKCFTLLANSPPWAPPVAPGTVAGEWANPGGFLESEVRRFRTTEGGFSYDPTGKGRGFPYAAFLALNIYQDLGWSIPEPERLISALHACRQPDGRFAHPGSKSPGLLLSTVAGLLTLRQLTGEIDTEALKYIENQFAPVGGWKTDPGSELPDLLSTAVALFAIRVCGVDMTPYGALTRTFVEDHWLPGGGFSATLADDIGDCEYVYYGLLSLGALHAV